jgi:hypothetical protein
MGESLKAVLGALVIMGTFRGMTWLMDEPWVWKARLASSLMIAVPGILLIREKYRKDLVPDYLGRQMGEYFERNGFCFAVRLKSEKVCELEVYFQNQYAMACQVMVSLEPTMDGLDLSGLETLKLSIACAPGAYGKVSQEMLIPAQLKGTVVQWDVTASVEYPNGRGKLLRYHNGLRVGNRPATGTYLLTLASLFAGHIYQEKPARISLQFPEYSNASGNPVPPRFRTFWQVGDPLL